MDELVELSLIERKAFEPASDRKFSTHPLVHEWTRERLNIDEKRQNSIQAVLIVVSILKLEEERTPEYLTWERRIRGHLFTLERHLSRYFSQVQPCTLDESIYNSISKIAHVFIEWCNYDVSSRLLNTALEGLEKLVGPDHPSTLSMVFNISRIFNNKGQYDKALEWYQRALDGYENSLGSDHPSTLRTVNNMAIVFRKKGENDKALEWYQRALDGYENSLGNDHPETLDTIYNIGDAYEKQNQYEEALKFFRKAYNGYQKYYGENSETVDILKRIARVEEKISTAVSRRLLGCLKWT